MEIGWLILMIFFIIYGLFLGAMVFHLNTYAFSRSAKWMSNLIIVLAAALSLIAIFSCVPAVYRRSFFSAFCKYNRNAFAFYILLVNMAINSRLDRIRPVDGLLS